MALPHCGQTVATKTVLDLLKGAGLSVEVHDTGAPAVRRVMLHLRAAWALAASPAPSAYLSVNSRLGIGLTIMLCLAARVTRKAITLHYHTGRYIARWEPAVAALVKLAGTDALHVTQCEGMAARLRRRYGARCAMGFSNIGSVDPRPVAREVRTRLVLGHFGNLSAAKGISEAIRTFEAVLADREVSLIIAGPCWDRAAKRAVREAAMKHRPRFRYLGPVHGDAKRAFFRSIDLFLFPSRYASESQGIVNLEALAAGVPVIAYDAGSIGRDIGQTGGVALPRDGDFARAVKAFIDADRPNRARWRFQELLAAHEAEKQALLARFGRTAAKVAEAA